MHYINLLLTLTCLGASAEQLQGRSQTYLHWPVTDWTTATTGANTAIPPPGGERRGSAKALLKAGRAGRNPATLHALAALIYVPAASVKYRTFSSPFDICPL